MMLVINHCRFYTVKNFGADSTPNMVCPHLLYTDTTFSVVSTPMITGVSGTLIWCCMHTTIKCAHYPQLGIAVTPIATSVYCTLFTEQ